MTEVKWFGDDILAQIREHEHDALFEAGEKFIEAAASKAPVGDSGDLAKSGYVVSAKRSTYKSGKRHRKEIKVKGDAVAAGFAAFYARYIEYGTKPHKIGKAGQLIRLKNGDVVRGPVQHPGTRAKPFLRPALDELKSQLGAEAAAYIKVWLK